jgi:hypothetical protein
MSTKTDCQTAQTAAEAALVALQKQEDERTSNGDDSRKQKAAALATAIAEVRTQIDGLA